jgi:hypothetical protein
VISRLLLWHHHCNYGTWLVLHLGGWYEATKLLGGSMIFQEATSEPAGKSKKPTAWHLMPHNKQPGKQGCNCQFRNHKIFKYLTLAKHRMVTTCSQYFFMFSTSVLIVFIASLSAVVYQLLFVILPVALIYIHSFLFNLILFLFCLIHFVWLFSVRLLDFWCYFLFWYWHCIPGILIHNTLYQQPSGKSINIIPQDCAVFCLTEV